MTEHTVGGFPISRDPKSWFRNERDTGSLLSADGDAIFPDRDAAHNRFHELMLSGSDEHAGGTISVFSLFDEFGEWTKAQRVVATLNGTLAVSSFREVVPLDFNEEAKRAEIQSRVSGFDMPAA
jgi:hypothetical protein